MQLVFYHREFVNFRASEEFSVVFVVSCPAREMYQALGFSVFIEKSVHTDEHNLLQY